MKSHDTLSLLGSRKLWLVFPILAAIFLTMFALASPNDPAEFGNLTATTCYIGGSSGIVNCTGNAYFNNIFGISNSSNFWDNLDDPTDISIFLLLSGGTMTGNILMDDGAGQSPKIRFYNELDNISEIYEQTDGDLYIKAADGFELAGASFRMTTLTNCDTIDTDATGVLSCGTDADSGDTNASTACSTDEVLLGNGSCFSSAGFFDDTDTHVKGEDIYLYNDSTVMYFNETKLNTSIDARAVTSEVDPLWTANFSLYNSSWSYYEADTNCSVNGSCVSIIYWDNESILDVNSSDYWDGLNIPSDLNYKILIKEANVTDENWIEDSQLPLANKTLPYCGNITGATSNLCTLIDTDTDTNASTACSGTTTYLDGEGNCDDISGVYIDEADEGTLNVNSSNYWDALNTPSDINAGDITDDNTYVTTSGDTMTGSLTMDDGVGESPRINFYNELDNLSTIYEQTDGDLYISAADGFELAGTSFRMTTLINCDTIDTDGNGVLSCGTDADSGDTNASTACSAGEFLEGDGTCTDVIEETELDILSELNTQLSDAVLVDTGIMTNAKWCKYNSATTDITCNVDPVSDTDTDTHVAGDGDYLYNDSTTMYLNETRLNATIELLDSDTNLTTEDVQDIAGAMVSSNTETHISVDYQDGDGTLDFVVSDDWWDAYADFMGATTTDKWCKWNGSAIDCNVDPVSDSDTWNTTEEMQDACGAMATNGTGGTLVFDDTGNLLTAGFDCSDVDGDYLSCSGETLNVEDHWYDAVSDIPHATPSDGDVTHFSLADEIYDWVIGLSYATITYVDSLGNWSGDKGTYWNESSDLDNDELAEAKIGFSTVCAAGNHLYINGNDLACEADDDTTYTAGNKLYLTATEFNVNDTEINQSIEAYGYITNVSDVWINESGDATGDLTSDLNIDSNTFVISYDDNRVGIGTDSPDSIFDVASTTDDVFPNFQTSGAGKSAGFKLYSPNSKWLLHANSTGGFFGLTDQNSAPPYATRLAVSNSTGYVGIGTTTPGAKLHVNGSAIILQDNNAKLSFRNAAGTERAYLTFTGTGVTTLGADNKITISPNDGANGVTTFAANGRVGIGTTSPDSKLHIREDTNDAAISFSDGSDTPEYVMGVDATDSNFKIHSGSALANTSDIRIATDGRVGLNFGAVPYRSLIVSRIHGAYIAAHNSDAFADIDSGETIGTFEFSGGDDSAGEGHAAAYIRGVAAENWSDSESGADITFSTTAIDDACNPVERMRLSAEGELGIGTNNPVRWLDLKKSSGSKGLARFDSSGTHSGTGVEINILNSSSSRTGLSMGYEGSGDVINIVSESETTIDHIFYADGGCEATYGLYILAETKNYLSGALGLNELNPDSMLEVKGEVHITDTNTGANAGTDLCIDANGRICTCGSCA